MRTSLLLLLALTASTAAAQLQPQSQTVQPGAIVDRIPCKADPTQSYALYLPSSYDASKPHPALLIFDPRGRALIAAELFREAAERHGWILMSSWDTRSDTKTNEPNAKAIAAMWPELVRYAVNPRRIYATGFSGGSVLAWLLAQGNTSIAGVIGVGGRLPTEVAFRKPAYAHFGAAGDADFNYLEMKDLDALLEKHDAVHRFETFAGPHRWFDAPLAAEAILWMELEAMKRELRPRDDAIIEQAWTADVEAARALEAAEDWPSALRRWESIGRTFSGLRDAQEATARAKELRAQKDVASALRDEAKWDDYERGYIRTKSMWFGSALRNSEDTIAKARLENELRIQELLRWSKGDDARARAAGRILATVLVQYSFYLPAEFMAAGDYRRAELVLSIAVDIRDDDRIAWYNLACARARTGDKRRALDALEKAVALGYRDRQAIDADTDLASVRTDARYTTLMATLDTP